MKTNTEKKISESDILWVDWDGPEDPKNPKNWSYSRKWAATIFISTFTFMSPVSSSMIAPAAAQLSHDFGITNSIVMAMTTSVFVLGYAIGPLFIAPLCEIYGRSRVLQISNAFYLAWNIGCGFAQNTGQLIAFRFLAGLGGSAPLSIGGGVIGDIWSSEERGKAIAVYTLAPLLGPVLGPVCGGWVAEKSTWRWVFWSTSILDLIVQVSGFFFLQESYAPCLLERKANAIRKTMDLESGPYKAVISVYDNQDRSWQKIFAKNMLRPFQLFAREPIIQALGLYMAFIYGIFYLFLTTIPTIFADVYHENSGIAGSHYIGLGIGLVIACYINAMCLDRIYAHFKNKNGGAGRPEYRLPTMVPGSFILPVGLLLSGWAAQHHWHWIVTDIGMALFGVGMILCFLAIQTYVIDAFTLHAASALAAVSCLRSLAGFGFPLFAPAMFDKLGYGKGDTVLACLGIGLGCPVPFLLWKYGQRMRMSSKYAHKTVAQQYQFPIPKVDASQVTVNAINIETVT